jgi:hypothetical protein
VSPELVSNIAVRLASTVPQFSTEWAAERLRLPVPLVETVFWQLQQDQLVEILGQNGPFSYRYSLTQRGREHATRLFEICGYVGPAPVSLEAYTAMLVWQGRRFAPVTLEKVRRALEALVLPESIIEVAALAALSGRSLFMFGPPGNGKTSLARLLHQVAEGTLWIPHSVAIGREIVRIFDPQCHRPVADAPGPTARADQRWVCIHRPCIVAGGEMTIAEVDLAYSPSARVYEAPPHVKANGGMFVIDDFGRQRVAPHDLLNRWIVPLEHQTDFLTLASGQKIAIPFHLMLIVATNLPVSEVADPAFLRRMGYRLHLQPPDAERFRQIFEQYAARNDAVVEPGLVDRLLARYAAEGRELRACEPRDLIERARDVCRLRDWAWTLTSEILAVAWAGYFGDQLAAALPASSQALHQLD